jgi:hypothetical protein
MILISSLQNLIESQMQYLQTNTFTLLNSQLRKIQLFSVATSGYYSYSEDRIFPGHTETVSKQEEGSSKSETDQPCTGY